MSGTGVLETVNDLVTAVRGLLLDRVQPYRYQDTDILVALNTSLLEGRRLRPDLFVCRYGNAVPSYSDVTSEELPIEPQFRLAFAFGTAGYTLLRDEDDVQDERAAGFTQRFQDILVGIKLTPVTGATPPAGNPQR